MSNIGWEDVIGYCDCIMEGTSFSSIRPDIEGLINMFCNVYELQF